MMNNKMNNNMIPMILNNMFSMSHNIIFNPANNQNNSIINMNNINK